MRPYRNLGGRSGVLAFEIGETYIKVMFGEGIYTYSDNSAGKENIVKMKMLALNGSGLNTFIDEQVKNGFEYKDELR